MGARPALSQPATAAYHLWGVTPGASAGSAAGGADDTSLFQNQKVKIDTSLEGLARLAGSNPPVWLTDGLHQIQTGLATATPDILNKGGVDGAHTLDTDLSPGSRFVCEGEGERA